MKRAQRVIGSAAVAMLTAVLAGCSADTLIWGQDGSQVIETTERLIDAAAAGEGDAFICDGFAPELRAPGDWKGLSAEEPEQFVEEYWPEQARHDPEWSINLSLAEDRVAAGVQYPGDVFYRETEDGLCLVDVAWWTVED